MSIYDDAVREYAYNAGMDNPECAWILSPYDSWERNPHYNGPAVPHPEDEYEAYYDASNDPYDEYEQMMNGEAHGTFVVDL